MSNIEESLHLSSSDRNIYFHEAPKYRNLHADEDEEVWDISAQEREASTANARINSERCNLSYDTQNTATHITQFDKVALGDNLENALIELERTQNQLRVEKTTNKELKSAVSELQRNLVTMQNEVSRLSSQNPISN